MPRRLLVVIESLRPGGAERLVVTTLSALDRTRFVPEVATVFEEGELADEVRALGIPVHGLGVDRRRALDVLRATAALRGLIARRGVDVVHTHLFFANVMGRLAAAGLAPVVSTLHNPDYTHEDDGTLRFRVRKLLDRATAALPRVTLTAVSEEVGRDFARHFGRTDIQVIPNFMDVAAFQAAVATADRTAVRRALGVGEADVLALHVGRFHPQKAHDVLLEAFARARVAQPALRLALVGAGRGRKEAEARAAALGLAGAVSFLGTRLDMPVLYAAADVFVFPSRFEAFGISLLEAMAAGLPAAVTRAGGIVEVATEETALFVEVDRPGPLADAILALACDEDLRRRLGEAARRRAAVFDARTVVPRLEVIYAGV